ncbi:unnamed protein product [Cladocopium goreaui]|uniref:SAM domain-containing protein n=1 Tax=Cladocopium goreaui TaxID=2562237 RepID=A0A9P1GI83_9DINO|nr:unnamed protein product [Cladocopium goreaui]
MASSSTPERAEELLWSLGVGENLPKWLKESRKRATMPMLNEKKDQIAGGLPTQAPAVADSGQQQQDNGPVQVSLLHGPLRGPSGPCAPAMSLKDWLESLDEDGFLVQYHDKLASGLDSIEQMLVAYTKQDGEIDPKFFEDVDIKKLGHRRLFQQWFREQSRKLAAQMNSTQRYHDLIIFTLDFRLLFRSLEFP